MGLPSISDISLAFRYYRKARTKYDAHSPFFHHFISEVLDTKKSFYIHEGIENLRDKLLRINKNIEYNDLGAGSKSRTGTQRNIKDIAKNSSTNERDGKILFNLVIYNDAKTVLELGTSLGIGTSYLASAASSVQVHTLEGDPASAYIASRNFNLLGLNNVSIHEGAFSRTLPNLLKELPTIDIAYIDGDHTYEATFQYFSMIKSYLSAKAVVVFDDIYWSKGMQRAWSEIIKDDDVKASLDIYSKGFVFFDPEIITDSKHFTLIPTSMKPWRIGLFP